MVLDHTSHMVCVGKLSLLPTGMKHAPTPERSLDNQRQTVLPSSWVTSSPPHDSIGVGGERFHPSGYTVTSAYWAHIPACDWYVQWLLTVANPSVLNRHRQGIQPWRCQLSTYHSTTFPTSGLLFPPKGATWSPVIHPIITN
jgi:hypothetical protein